MAVQRLMPTEESAELINLVRDICEGELAPRVADYEDRHEFPTDVIKLLGQSGLMSLPYPAEFGGADQSYEVYLQALEEIASHWMSLAVDLSVHTMVCYPVATFGTDEQKKEWLPWLLSGDCLGAYCLSESQAGSDVAAIKTKAERTDSGYKITGTKVWISHGSHADVFVVFARTSDDGGKGLSAFMVKADTPGISFTEPERKMGMNSSPTVQVIFEGVEVSESARIGAEGKGMSIALTALNSGRLGIAACATGLAQGAVNLAVDYAKEREQFGRSIAAFQGVQFMLADMEAAVQTSRAQYLHAARLRDAGREFTREAAISKLAATDAAMKVTTDAVQVLGGAGYVKDYAAERYMREAKVTQIFEGTNQIQRMIIGRDLTK